MVKAILVPRFLFVAIRRGPRFLWQYLEIVLRLWFLRHRWRFPRAPWHRCGSAGCGYDPFDWPGDDYDRRQDPEQQARNKRPGTAGGMQI